MRPPWRATSAIAESRVIPDKLLKNSSVEWGESVTSRARSASCRMRRLMKRHPTSTTLFPS
jgi:hypothetical protein